MNELSAKMLAAQDEERRRIAREMHDSIGQDLTLAKLSMDRIEHPQERERQSRLQDSSINALQQVRNISYLLHPPLLDELGLASAIQGYLEGTAARSGICISPDVQPQHFSPA